MQNRYPWWKSALVIVLTIIGLIYAAPNLYGDDPSIQLSGVHGARVDTHIIDTVKNTLTTEDLTAKSIKIVNDNLIVIRFKEVNTQLKARDFLKAALGHDYTVALNLAPATPHWLNSFGAGPMKLGLDLRGGVHFLLAVDVDSVIAKREAEQLRGIARALRKQRIRYSGVAKPKHAEGMVIHFRDVASLHQAMDYLKNDYRQFIFTENTDKGFVLTAHFQPDALTKMQQEVVDQTMTVLRNRVNELGIAEPVIQQQGKGRISVDLPGIQDAAQAKRILGGTATLEFHLVDSTHDVSTALAGTVPAGTRVYRMSNGTPLLLLNQILLKGSDITSATSSYGQDGRPSVSLAVSGADVSYFSKVTRDSVGQRMAIVYVETKNQSKLVNGKVINRAQKVERVISAPTIQSALGANFEITGITDPQEAKNLALLLRAGALPANIYPIAETTVGPSLGKDNIHKGVLSVEIGFLIIVVFMGLYYRLMGMFANLALAANLILTVAALSMMGATLTLPGIAGLVLAVGMAVDANVLINERIREELRNGMSAQAAIHVGYEKAFITIVDANVTTLIVAVVLFAIGSGSVKGFAVTLMIGLVISMFTAITGTRALVNWVYGGKQLKNISIGI
ncbi:MAG: protein translocase subunit SecD [marine bacterium B5-7]|nr:MAG: protein translocase subunit SecD [marine bacterium B5-7]